MTEDPRGWPDTLTMCGIQVCVYMAGCKHAVQDGDGPIMVSPAMFDLIRNANERELRHLLQNIKVLKLPKWDPFDLPMTFAPESNPFR